MGGSISRNPEIFKRLCKFLNELYKEFPFVIIPGGGVFADYVREIDKLFSLTNYHSHYMAILSMDLLGYLIYSQTPNSKLFFNISDLKHDENLDQEIKNNIEILKNISTIPIILPFKFLLEKDPLPHSWDITSDSIAYYMGIYLKVDKIILVKDVDGLYNVDPNLDKNAIFIDKITAIDLAKFSEKTCVDKCLSKLIQKYKKPCYLVNGEFPTRIKEIIENKKTKCTIISIE
ncbi:MAG: amino acid kinase family protein [Candidatus Helarchaeota archaeon]